MTPSATGRDVVGMRIHTLAAIAASTLLASTGAAHAQSDEQPTPVPKERFTLVQTEITISDASGAEVKTLSCEWREPAADDRQCLRFKGDPKGAFRAIEEAGGVSAVDRTVSKNRDTKTVFSRRGDGTWLIRLTGEIGRPVHSGWVCSEDGATCVEWDAWGAKSARKDVQAAAAKLRAK